MDLSRKPISRSQGLTESEKYLAKLADRTFLNLWSYPNPYRSQKLGGTGDGKEICDLLVVCEPHVLIFSEKDIRWTDKPLDVAWPRWCRRAIFDAAAQLKGAERWINEFPDRVYLDKQCETAFPLNFPAPSTRRLHRIVVARGAKEAGRRYFEGGLGTFIVKPSIKGLSHLDTAAAGYQPFAIGDIDPEGDFIHVFDEVSLDIVLRELDTVTDFTEYLDKRAAFLRSGNLEIAHGEEDLLAYYASRTNQLGEHDFTPPSGKSWGNINALSLAPGNWTNYISNPQYVAKKAADEVSYVWDELINTFTEHMIGGTNVVLPGHSYSITNSELAVRYMALQSRFLRRSHGEAVLGALEIGRKKDCFFRAMLAPGGSAISETGFFFLTLKYMKWMESRGGYARYREIRTFYLQTYSQALLIKHPHLQRVVGIAMEPPGQGDNTSEDICYAAQVKWSDEQKRQNRADCAALGIMGAMKETRFRGKEYPAIKYRPETNLGPNRKQRRAMSAKNRGKI